MYTGTMHAGAYVGTQRSVDPGHLLICKMTGMPSKFTCSLVIFIVKSKRITYRGLGEGRGQGKGGLLELKRKKT